MTEEYQHYFRINTGAGGNLQWDDRKHRLGIGGKYNVQPVLDIFFEYDKKKLINLLNEDPEQDFFALCGSCINRRDYNKIIKKPEKVIQIPIKRKYLSIGIFIKKHVKDSTPLIYREKKKLAKLKELYEMFDSCWESLKIEWV